MTKAESVTDKPIAIVTGVGPGTGSAIVRRFAAGGFRVIALARSPDRIRALERELPDTHAMICDVSSEGQVADTVSNVRKFYGAPNVLIHNAVGGGWGTFLEIDPQMLPAADPGEVRVLLDGAFLPSNLVRTFINTFVVIVGETRILITSRLYPADLENREGGLSPGCAEHELKGLTDADALVASLSRNP